MESSRSSSFFQDIRSREVNGFRVPKRPYPDNELSNFSQIGAVSMEHSGIYTPPMALSFCKTSKNSHIVAVSDEDGYISLYNTRFKFTSSSTYQENAEKSRVCEWIAHENAIFDVCWIKIKLWDALEKKCIATLMGHTGTVKSVCCHPTNSDLIVSGSRDGSFALWDLRCANQNGKPFVTSLAKVREAHISPHGKRFRRGKSASVSITSVLYLKDEVSIATAGAVHSVVKFWDVRNLKGPVIWACPDPELSTVKQRRLHGISSLSQDLNGVFISASCMDNRIYLYNVLQLEKGPINSFSGCRIGSFFVKSAISPDAAHILGGSSDGNAYIWQVNKPRADPTILKGHDGEVTAVDWCQSEVGKIATSSDDFTVCFWNIENSGYSNSKSPSSIRRRVMAPPTMECRKLLPDAERVGHEKGSRSSSSNEVLPPINSTNSHTMPEFGSPKSQKKIFSSDLHPNETLEKTPEAALKSPSSVLNPPSSLKRTTIRDYFLASS
ncbi:Denticleless protein [Actinidia chinensis var. chinensis]|uniref:Denticleless protein n=1 Tax=Actinidia chinensis var. chinensis TaxID=1590841 RepID=A0A2R6RK28_ACTCC|nr:Denticleless protein [Actinidia chinensis var. chinensis]